MKLIDYFKTFLTDTVNLKPSKLEDLDERVPTLTEVVKGGVRDGERSGNRVYTRGVQGGQAPVETARQILVDLPDCAKDQEIVVQQPVRHSRVLGRRFRTKLPDSIQPGRELREFAKNIQFERRRGGKRVAFCQRVGRCCEG